VAAQDQHGLGLDQLVLGAQVGQAGLRLVGHGVAVLGRPALEHVGDVDGVAAEADPLQELVEQLARGSHERLALDVLV